MTEPTKDRLPDAQTKTPTLSQAGQPVATSIEDMKSRRTLDKPWAPTRVLEIPAHMKDPRFAYRWASKDQVGRIQKLLGEGWEVDKELSKKLSGLLPSTLDDGKPLDGTVQRRELIVMRIPKELAEARKEYYAGKGAARRREEEERLKAAGKTADGRNLVYGDIRRS